MIYNLSLGDEREHQHSRHQRWCLYLGQILTYSNSSCVWGVGGGGRVAGEEGVEHGGTFGGLPTPLVPTPVISSLLAHKHSPTTLHPAGIQHDTIVSNATAGCSGVYPKLANLYVSKDFLQVSFHVKYYNIKYLTNNSNSIGLYYPLCRRPGHISAWA